MSEDFLSERQRAEDILLGALGYGEDASIITIERIDDGFKGTGRFSDGDTFIFENEDELTELEKWALDILHK